jgi:hypothetical protein
MRALGSVAAESINDSAIVRRRLRNDHEKMAPIYVCWANTPVVSLFQPAPYTARHSHSASFPITSPISSSAADQISAEMKLAIWNGQ